MVLRVRTTPTHTRKVGPSWYLGGAVDGLPAMRTQFACSLNRNYRSEEGASGVLIKIYNSMPQPVDETSHKR